MSGLWSLPEVPKQGWYCVDIHDLGVSAQTCEMCDRQRIRYVHTMRHKDFKRDLKVGCVCAGCMEGDLEAAQEREKGIKRLHHDTTAPNNEAKTWIKAADKILEIGALSEKELKFVQDMRSKFTRYRGFEPSERQSDWFIALYQKAVR